MLAYCGQWKQFRRNSRATSREVARHAPIGLPATKSRRSWLPCRHLGNGRPLNTVRRNVLGCYLCGALHFAHLALLAALIRARPAAEMRRLGAIATTFPCPFTLAHRARCAAAILARAAALMVRRPRADPPVLFTPLSALIAVSSAFTCCADLSRSTFNI
jgi:hypothetical protein